MLFSALALILLIAVPEVFVVAEHIMFHPVKHYIGCYLHNENILALKPYIEGSPKMTHYLCLPKCQDLKKKFFGIGFDKCYCGNSIRSPSVPIYRCDRICSSIFDYKCGGNGVLSVYNVTGKIIPLLPAPSKGCYLWTPEERVLHAEVLDKFPVMNQEVCARSCLKKQALLFGLANGNRCFCGNVIISEAAEAVIEKRFCDKQCHNAESGQKCGGAVAIEIFDLVTTQI
ncbi:hypothetical protein BOX15_Mlig026601g1 [Macrostomum lignano]|uniref:WSC domain-containing protein n=1 Tax=Macrostomum lignano TaxID=282301 RepID=A0A267H397_9PLAT|nr:hypothetical protein BOX15_Mlig026601g1 [Macrostomum lignano]